MTVPACRLAVYVRQTFRRGLEVVSVKHIQQLAFGIGEPCLYLAVVADLAEEFSRVGQLAHLEAVLLDDAGDWRLHGTVAQVCLCHCQLRLCLLDRCLSHMISVHACREDVVADDPFFRQLLVRLILQLRCLHLRLCSRQVCLRVLYLQLVSRLVDDEERLPLRHLDAVLEVHLTDDTRHLRIDFHFGYAMKRGRNVNVVHARLRLHHPDFVLDGILSLLVRTLAASRYCGCQCQDRQSTCPTAYAVLHFLVVKVRRGVGYLCSFFFPFWMKMPFLALLTRSPASV